MSAPVHPGCSLGSKGYSDPDFSLRVGLFVEQNANKVMACSLCTYQ